MKDFLAKAKAAVGLVLVLMKDQIAGLVLAVRKAIANVLHKIEELVAPKV